jgi:hypothetical protein
MADNPDQTAADLHGWLGIEHVVPFGSWRLVTVAGSLYRPTPDRTREAAP